MLTDFLDRMQGLLRRKKKAPSPYAAYNERMMAMAIDLFAALLVLRPVFDFLDRRISVFIHEAAVQSGLPAVLEQAQHQPPTEQFLMVVRAVFASDVWWLVLINHGCAFLLLAAALTTMQYSMRTTPGKWLVGIKLTCSDMQTTPGFWRVVVRYLACLPSCALLMVGMFWIMIDKKKRAWHDIASGTVVITLRPDGWYWQQMKRGYRWVRAKISGAPLPANESVAQPAAEQ